MTSEPRVKICGITREQDAVLADILGAWAVGFIFTSQSPRCVKAERARAIGEEISDTVKKIGVFVDAEPARLSDTIDAARLDGVQLHGNESLEYCQSLKINKPELFVMKAIRVGETGFDLQPAAFSSCDAILLDSPGPRADRNSRRPFAWSISNLLERKTLMFLAGGLNPTNVAAAIRAVAPDGIDVASGIEAAPGIKDAGEMRAFFAAIRRATE